MNPLVSIMIATYNQPQYIERAVTSALNQDYDNLEIIVSDDSTDDCTLLLLTKLDLHKNIYYHKNANNIGRVANYRRLLYELAKGEWVVMLDGDDYYTDNNYITKALNIILQNSSIVLVGAGIQVLNEGLGTSTDNILVKEDIIFKGSDIFKKKMTLPNHQTDIYLRSLACSLDFYRDPSMASDSESLFRLCLHGDVAYIADIVAVWRIHDLNTTFNRNLNLQIKELVFIDSVYNYAINFIDKNIAEDWRIYMYRGMSFHLLNLAKATGKVKYALSILLVYRKYFGIKETMGYLYNFLRGK